MTTAYSLEDNSPFHSPPSDAEATVNSAEYTWSSSDSDIQAAIATVDKIQDHSVVMIIEHAFETAMNAAGLRYVCDEECCVFVLPEGDSKIGDGTI